MCSEIGTILNYLPNGIRAYSVAVVLFIILVYRLAKRELCFIRENMLSTKVKQLKESQRKKMSLTDRLKHCKDFFLQLYYPSLKSLFFVVVAYLFFVIASKCLSFLIPPFDANSFPNLLQLQVGIVAISLPIIIFIVGLSGNKLASGVNISEVLLKESFLFPIEIFILLLLITSVWSQLSFIIVFQIIVSTILFIFILFKVIQILLNDQKLLQRSIDLLKDKVRRSIESAIDERLGNKILLDSLGEGKIELKYQLLRSDNEQDKHYLFTHNHEGLVRDINLYKLNKFAKLVEKLSISSGYSFYPSQKEFSQQEFKADDKEISSKLEKITLQENKNRFIEVCFMDSIAKENAVVLSVEKDLIKDKSYVRVLNNLAQQIFTVKKDKKELEKLRIELRNLKDQLIDDIHNKRLGRISNLKEVYTSLSELFMEIMDKYSSSYTMTMARQERGNIIGEWAAIKWITNDLRDIYEIAMQTHDRNVIREIGYLPIGITIRAIRLADHYIFEKCLYF